MLYSTNTASLILGALCNNPTLMLGEKYNFCKEDFSPIALHKIIFVCINNIAKKGVKKIDEIAINEYLDSYQAQKEIFGDNNGLSYIKLITSLAMEETFDFYYDKLKIYSVLRDYKKLKFDISEVYDETKDEDEEKSKLAGYTLQEIIDIFEGKQSNIRKKYLHNANIETMIGGTDFDELLDKFQEEPMIGAGMVSQITNSLYRGWCRGHLNLRGAPSSFGKAQPNYTIIPTPNGDRKVGDIRVGDYLFAQDGNPTKVLAIHPQEEQKEIYEVHFADGRVVECCGEHLWEYGTYEHRKYRPKVSTTNDILNITNGIFKNEKYKSYKYVIPTNKPIIFKEKKLSVDPYVMGVMLGDGTFRGSGMIISSEDNKIPNMIGKIVNASAEKCHKNNYSYKFRDENNNLIKTRDVFKDYKDLLGKYSHNKYIPRDYLQASVSQRYSLLSGLLDTDGSISKKSGAITFSTCSNQLSNDIQYLCRSLGMITSVCISEREGKGISYVVMISCDKYIKPNLFRLDRKKEIAIEYASRTNRYESRDYLAIKNIVPTGKFTDMTCFTVDNERCLYLTNDFIVTHNTCIGIADQVNVSMKKIWDREQEKYIDNECYKGKGAYIHTEQKSETEIQTRFASTIAKVPYHKILDGLYDVEEKKRLSKAGKYMLDSEIKIINYPNFTSSGLRELIGDLSREGYEYITFDYIWNNSYIMSDLKKTMGLSGITEVSALLNLSNSLKMIAEDFNVGIATMMQLNGKEKELDVVDESCLYGSRAVKTKLDNGAVYMYPKKKELAQVNELINQWNEVNTRDRDYFIMPNAVSHCFKCRYSRYGMNLKIWHYVDNGTGEIIDLFATTADNEYINVPHLIIN